jgi:hypothetical protein
LYEDTSLIDGNTEIAGKPLVEHKLGGEDRPFHLSIAPIWELPVGRGKKFGSGMPKIANAVVGGWELTGQYTIQSGVPVVFSNNSFFTGKDFALPRDKQSLDQWFDTSQFLAFPSKNTPIASIPAWTGVQNLPGYSYVPAPGDSAKNGVYQDFATYIRNYPTRWSDVRASRVNELNLGIFKNFHPTERTKLQLRFEAFNAFNHPRFPLRIQIPPAPLSASFRNLNRTTRGRFRWAPSCRFNADPEGYQIAHACRVYACILCAGRRRSTGRPFMQNAARYRSFVPQDALRLRG